MRRAPPIVPTPADRRVLREWAAARRSSGRRSVRARIVLAAAGGGSNSEIARATGVTTETVSRWRTRFQALGIDGLRREAPRAGAPTRVSRELVGRVLRSTIAGRPSGRPWTTRSLARALRTNHMSVHRIWREYGLTRAAPSRPTQVDLLGVLRGRPASALVFGFGRSNDRSPGGSGEPSGPGSAGPASPAPTPEELIARLRSTDLFRPRVRRPLAGGPSLVVFLRAIEAQTDPSVRLDAIVDRPLSALGERVVHWLADHPRIRVYPTGPGGAWDRSTEAWLRRWPSARLGPDSLRLLDDYQRSGAPVRTGSAARTRSGRDPSGRGRTPAARPRPNRAK